MRIGTQIVSLLVIGALVAGGWSWFSDLDSGAAAKKPRRAETRLAIIEPVTLSTDSYTIRAIGTGKALHSASLYASVSGEVVAIAFKAQQTVKSGQVLLRLDDVDQQLAVRLAKIEADEAARQARRLESLKSGVVARARLETARASLESARVRLARAKATLKDRTVFAPFTGIIGLSDVHKGDRITPDTLITTLDDRSALLVEFAVSEDAVVHIKPGGVVSLTAWALPDRTFEGVIAAMGSRIDPVSRTLTVRARISNPDEALRPGASFSAAISIKGKRLPSIREVAVLWSRDGAFVWRVRNGAAEKVFVKVVRRDEGNVLVDGPLEEGDRIVVEGVQGLRPGQKVKADPSSNPSNPSRES
ncbi:MAG: efflux RND transporter periplasmic adaptor subunit [Alphaproteobacteria bacterium]|nr:efflux RND transporter periplasmic adaptor subunit [Alphaproteobacteria bacterium]